MEKIIEKANENMVKTIELLTKNYASIRAGRANPALLEKIKISYFGTPTPINQLAAISITGSMTISIQPWDASICSDIEKAIQTSDIGINPQSDGKTIHITFPALTEATRREIVKEISAMSENAKISIRTIRRDVMEKLKRMKKDSEISEDELKRGEKKVQDLTDKYSKEISNLASKKEKEIMEI
jgi:ribosome recycling factor